MPKYSIDNTTLTNIANPLRELRGLTDGMTPEEMATNVNAVQTNVTNALAKIAEKGVVVPDGANSDDLPGLIDAIETGSGGGTPETCTVTISGNHISMLVGMALVDGAATVAAFAPSSTSVEVVKNTPLTVVLDSGRYSLTSTGGLSLVAYYGAVYCYDVTGDGTITVS